MYWSGARISDQVCSDSNCALSAIEMCGVSVSVTSTGTMSGWLSESSVSASAILISSVSVPYVIAIFVAPFLLLLGFFVGLLGSTILLCLLVCPILLWRVRSIRLLFVLVFCSRGCLV